MKNFLYVFSRDEKERLEALGYILLKSDEVNEQYIFENKSSDHMTFSENAVESDVLTF